MESEENTQVIYAVNYGQQYECGGTLRLFTNYDKAFAYLEEVVKGENGEYADQWIDDNFHVIPIVHAHPRNRRQGPVYWMYSMSDPSDCYYTIEKVLLY